MACTADAPLPTLPTNDDGQSIPSGAAGTTALNAGAQVSQPVGAAPASSATPAASAPAGQLTAAPQADHGALPPTAASAGSASPAPVAAAGASAPITPATSGPASAQDAPAAPKGGVQALEVSGDVWPEDCAEHFVFHAHGRPEDEDPSKYAMPAGDERIATFYFKPAWSQPVVQLLQSRERMDNPKLIHHWMLYLINSDEHPDGDILDDHNQQSLEVLLNQQSLVGGIPGGGDLTLPNDVGMRLPDNEQTYALSIHYLNASDTTQLDASGIEVCVTNRSRPHEAATHWLGASSITLPPHAETSVHGSCRPAAVNEPVHILSLTPHMHRLGTHARLDVQRASGESLSLLDVPYAFDEQKVYRGPAQHLPDELILGNGDSFLTTCTFNNTSDRQVTNGEHTTDEMCFMGVVAWPAGSLTNGNVLAGFNGLSVDQSCVE